MKQHITKNQLKELLNHKSKKKLREWWKPQRGDVYWRVQQQKICVYCGKGTLKVRGRNYNYPLLSISQMIEFITENENGERVISYTKKPIRRTSDGKNYDLKGEWWWTQNYNGHRLTFSYKELSDTLWEVCKEILK